MDSIVEFVGFIYKKGDKFDCSDFDDCLWEKPWVDIVENVEVEKDLLDQIREDTTNLVVFKEDCFSMNLNSIISLNPYSQQSGIEWIVNEAGFEEVFSEFNNDIIKLGLQKIKEEYKTKTETLNDILFNLKHDIIHKPSFIRVLTVWSFTSLGSGEDTDYEWDLLGTINYEKINSIVDTLNKD